MRLSQIKLAGFKSFVDPTVIPIPGNLVGIAGPNGCGKSNVIDAVRWVLGESRATALRGESIQDVIFSGSVSRKPVGRASVELIFDNRLGKLSGQWSAYSEISIKRVIQRDSESAYYINNMHVRRRDITDMFLGTGVSGRGYAIIEQGMISRIIEAKPMELRVFLEEAAGISKYRDRRHETELRLVDTHSNLLRVEDILRELEKQLQHLEKQATVAQRFNDLQEQLNTARHILWMTQRNDAIVQRTHAEEAIEQLETDLEKEIAFLHELDQKLEAMRMQQHAASEHLQHIQGELYTINAEVARIEQNLQHLQENKAYFAKQITVTETQLENNQQQLSELLDNLAAWHNEIELAQSTSQEITQIYQTENEKLPEVESFFRSKQEQWLALQKNLLLVQQSEKLHESDRTHADKAIQQLTLRQERLVQEKKSLPLVEDKKLEDLEQNHRLVIAQLEEKQHALVEVTEQLKVTQFNLKEASQKIQSIQQEITQVKARSAALQHLQRKLENNDALDSWLTQQQLDVLPRLWQYIQIEKNWENALEAILRERINAIAIDQLEIAIGWRDNLPSGKWCIFETDPSKNQPARTQLSQQKQWKPLSTFLIYQRNPEVIQPIMEAWLSGVYTLDDMTVGFEQQRKLHPGEMLITPEGHIFTYASLNYYAPDSSLHGILARQREIAQIEETIQSLETQHAILEAALAEIDETYQQQEMILAELRSDIMQLKQDEHQYQLETMRLIQLQERVTQRHQQIENELMEISHQIAQEYAHKQRAEEKLTENNDQIVILEEQLNEFKLISEEAEQALVEQRKRVQRLAEEMRDAIFHEKDCQNKIDQIEKDIQSINHNTASLTENLKKLGNMQADLDDEPMSSQLSEAKTKKKQLEQILIDARQASENLIISLRTTEQTRFQSEQKTHQYRDSINQTRLKEQEARLIENQYNEKLLESGANEEALLPLLNDVHLPRLKTKINQVTAEITALGPVNLAALEELQASQTRKQYLEEQLLDLKEAVETLEGAIRQIDRETRERLLKTFDKVNIHLNELFSAIFGGGQAKLVLSGDEILDAGMLLTAQPPGKKNNSIHLLSGGEKALTALALVFSLFRLNPAPFCLLDEVDAPLDDNNSMRFCDLVKRMSSDTQFLFISHNKTTIQMAEHLIGVTMQEQGVSRIVTVDLDKTKNIEKAAETI